MLQATEKAYAPSVDILSASGESHALTGRVIGVTPETIERGSRKIVEHVVPILPTLRRCFKALWQGINIGLMGWRYNWNKSRRTRVPYSARVTVTDPIVKIAEAEGIELPEDQPQLVLYRTERGVYFTESHIKDKAWCAKNLKGTVTFACDISEERASQLVDYLEAAKLETNLEPQDDQLLATLKRLLSERDAY